MILQKSIFYKGQLIIYELKLNLYQKNIILKVDGNKIQISTSVNTPEWQINNLIYKNIKLINKTLLDFENKKKFYWEHFDPNGTGTIKIFEQDYNIKLTNNNIHTFINEKTIFVKYDSDVNFINKKIYNFIKQKFFSEFKSLLLKWEKETSLKTNNFSLKIMKRKWGVCYHDKKLVSLNIKLIHFPKWVIEYVIVHELVHLKHHNHSRNFWNDVQKYIPDYKTAVNILKTPGI